MGVCVHYFAMPPQSDLYKHLEKDIAFNSLMFDLMSYGRLLYRFSDIGPDEAQEIIEDWLERYQSVLGSQPEHTIDMFFSEVEKTRIKYPGIDKRVVMLEKSSFAIEESLSQILEKQQGTPTDLAARIMWGNGYIHPTAGNQSGQVHPVGEDFIGLVLPSIVKEGAKVLTQLDALSLFPDGDGREGWYRENYTSWRSVYLEAAENGESLLVVVS